MIGFVWLEDRYPKPTPSQKKREPDNRWCRGHLKKDTRYGKPACYTAYPAAKLPQALNQGIHNLPKLNTARALARGHHASKQRGTKRHPKSTRLTNRAHRCTPQERSLNIARPQAVTKTANKPELQRKALHLVLAWTPRLEELLQAEDFDLPAAGKKNLASDIRAVAKSECKMSFQDEGVQSSDVIHTGYMAGWDMLMSVHKIFINNKMHSEGDLGTSCRRLLARRSSGILGPLLKSIPGWAQYGKRQSR
ncbi:Hypothetical predicted protein [Pelobates cultripes]|uniref:Uncharacterized protein n=1 Tax=Pelobates cultripes TaxID=61616 RepID=A0AAD1TN37_PELCU|nr:Hypothetical predicted protein [Pelobates cultripes]